MKKVIELREKREGRKRPIDRNKVRQGGLTDSEVR